MSADYVLKKRKDPQDVAGNFIMRMLDVFGAARVDEIPGRFIWVQRDNPFQEITGLRPLMKSTSPPFIFKEWQESLPERV